MIVTGIAEAEKLRPILAGRSFGVVLTSPLERARETSRLAGFGDRASVDEDLAEWDYGRYDGLTSEQIAAQDPGWSLWQSGGPDGEAPADVGARADRVIARVRSAGADVLLFSHGHMLRVLAARWLGLEPAAGRYFYLGTAAISVLGDETSGPVIRSWNLAAS